MVTIEKKKKYGIIIARTMLKNHGKFKDTMLRNHGKKQLKKDKI